MHSKHKLDPDWQIHFSLMHRIQKKKIYKDMKVEKMKALGEGDQQNKDVYKYGQVHFIHIWM